MTPSRTVRFFDRTTPPHIATLILIAGLPAMSLGIFLPSLPSMAQEFSTEFSVIQLAISLYLVTTAVLQLFVGPVSDRFGRRRVMLTSILLFMAATIGCLVAPDVTTFLFFRMLQAVIATGMVLSRAVVRDLYDTSESASVIGYVTMGMALVPMVAPMIGGVLDAAFGWRASFVLLFLAGGLVFTLCWFDQGETARGDGRSFREQIADYPALLSSPRFWGYVLTAGFASATFFGFLGGAAYVATEVFGLSPFWAGVGFGAPPVGYAIGNGLSGRYSVRFGIDAMILAGVLTTAVGMAASTVLTLAGLGTPVVFYAFCTTIGLGNGLVIPNATAGTLSVRPHLAGTASGLGGAFMIGVGAIASISAGIALEAGSGSLPLLLVLLVSSLLALVSILYVRVRSRRIGLA